MFAEERKSKILDSLNKYGKVKVCDLSQLYEVSEVTIRRDLQELEEDELIKRVHGGAILNRNTKFEPTFSEKVDKFYDEKESVGKIAASMIVDGDTIAIDAGTTTLSIAKYITAKDITVLTNSVDVAYELSKKRDVEVIVTGGTLRWETRAMVGPVSDNTLKNFRVDKAFMGSNGVCIINGLTTPNIIEASTKQEMIKIAKQTILLCDHTKFGTVYFAKIVDLDSVDIIITDNQLDNELLEKFEEKGVQIMTAK
ncbi:DeoR/GlpR family DNA-binding transcription regulator [Clostridium sp. CM028]|uniref:DeoR/GlpR family DNA-binding transcription regulator n=1 Tax=unclassified Clostridium TaxID=2614128 RepID=UPI001C0B2EB6|nr:MULTISPECIES: DeoR/GlpR family DNA-binding transcription regulator [unclassified Clostridium]MBU3093876.1 DeoR/GlpR family DNA-binding transcription regulator [Clostridium sp. CF011]MBW9147063.1 DeoR/GlpR family DNA-binding transcription regulator [Clostridium sp. CM027]MBW9150459.1 DeoR/GlpR family DNA-binding transcription regulator [Clostridium sp. CM028]UVE39980.1 DeoR/GlpR family DNA-binding transcription regulator [Clostridium sp. CM027]WAG68901.1 DeoR/GlpR family DNA-binding transcri